MAEAAQLCRQQGVKLSIGVYPWAEQISGRRLKSKQVLFWREFAKKERVGFVDLFPYFINKIPTEKILSMYFIPGDVHWNEAGHALVARGIMNNMEK
ncbi:MAG: hypothetical protein A2285_09885 [Elusimicrobia bacterium RIFOXYA12_FULL_57_11]|nr:MAG: hypothetical protein A2285_09885 [Elusimicrobia bacterium RIFOXYA12_FULL_57_11]